MGVSLQKVAGSSGELKVALSNKNSGKFEKNSGKQSISQFLFAETLLLQMLLEFTLQREAPIVCYDWNVVCAEMASVTMTSFVDLETQA